MFFNSTNEKAVMKINKILIAAFSAFDPINGYR